MSEDINKTDKEITMAEFIAKAQNKCGTIDSFFLESGGAKYIGNDADGIWIFPDGSELYRDSRTNKWATR